MKKTRLTSILIGFIIFFPIFSHSNLFADDILIQPGEELLYEVSFWGVKLGSIKFITEDNLKYNDNPIHKCKAFIDTYKGIPFIDLHLIFETWIDTSVSFSHKFITNTKNDNSWDFEQVLFNYKNGQISYDVWENNSKKVSKKFKITKKYNDGLSLFFMAREYLHSKRKLKIPTFNSSDTSLTLINFSGEKVDLQINSLKYKTKTVHFSGKAEWKSIYGLSGNFEGWFSDDEERIPIKAIMNVYLGNIVIELKSWKRNNWIPPKS